MEGNPQTSFIPKRPLVDGGGKIHTTNFFTVIATVIFTAIIILSVLVFGYKYYLTHQIDSTETSLKAQVAQFSLDLVSQLTRLDNRIESSKGLLNEHVALSGFFDFLANQTMQNIRFTSFSYTTTGGTGSIVLTGQATSFAAVASEANLLSQADNVKYLQNPLFSDLNLDSSGNVTFTLTGTVDTSAFLYRSLVSEENNGTVASTTTASDNSSMDVNQAVDVATSSATSTQNQ